MLTTAKHLPGHGDTATDTHLGLATIPADRQRLEEVELLPFRAAIAIAAGKPVTLVAMGNPYLLRSFPKLAAYLATFTTVAPAETSVVKALYGEIPIRGHMPVTIPDLAKYGEGIQLPALQPPHPPPAAVK